MSVSLYICGCAKILVIRTDYETNVSEKICNIVVIMLHTVTRLSVDRNIYFVNIYKYSYPVRRNIIKKFP